MVFQKELNNGIRIIAEQLPQYRSISLGVWVGTGSVMELPQEAGASHFIEHMLFKGTARRSASDIASEMDSIGGNINAFTSKECTCYYAKVLDENIEQAADILSDIVLHSAFVPEEIEKEKGVVCEEILMCEDTPEDMVHETLAALYYGETPLSKPILGTEQSVRSFTRDLLVGYVDKHYTPDNIVIACAGNFKEDELTGLLEEKFTSCTGRERMSMPESCATQGKHTAFLQKDVEQVHICLGLPGYALDTAGQYPLFVLNNALGGSMSSKLFQKIREQHGLAYSVYSYPSSYRANGSFSLYAGTGENQAADVVELMLEELYQLKQHGLTIDEFNRSKQQLKGSFLLGQESTSARMNGLGKAELLLGKHYTDAERLEKIEKVTMEDVQAAIAHVIDGENLCAAFVGRVSKQDNKLRKLIESY